MSFQPKPTTYEEWLALSDERREAVLYSWNAYASEGIGFPFIAAGRLALVSAIPILDVRVGTYHCGEYVIYVYVRDDQLLEDPITSFEGFRVYWAPLSHQGKLK